MSSFDDMPVGGGGKTNFMSEYPEDYIPPVASQAPASEEGTIDSNSSASPPTAISASESVPTSSIPASGIEEMEGAFPTESAEGGVVDTRPLVDRLGDKNWKTRLVAYDDLRKLVRGEGNEEVDANLFSKYLSWLPKMVADSNASALDAGLDSALVFVDLATQGIVTPISEKLSR